MAGGEREAIAVSRVLTVPRGRGSPGRETLEGQDSVVVVVVEAKVRSNVTDDPRARRDAKIRLEENVGAANRWGFVLSRTQIRKKTARKSRITE